MVRVWVWAQGITDAIYSIRKTSSPWWSSYSWSVANKKSWKGLLISRKPWFQVQSSRSIWTKKNPFNIKMFIFCQLWQGNRCQNKRSLWKAEVPRGKKGKKRLNLFGPTSTKRGGNQCLSVARLQNRSFYTECQGTHSWALPQYTLCPGNWFVQVRCVPSSLDEV